MQRSAPEKAACHRGAWELSLGDRGAVLAAASGDLASPGEKRLQGRGQGGMASLLLNPEIAACAQSHQTGTLPGGVGLAL